MNNCILEVKKMEKYYGNRGNITKAVNGLDLEIYRGEFVSIMGASGSGKTTLLNCVSTIDSVTSGHVIVNGVDITSFKSKELAKFRRESLGFVFQEYNLLDTLTGFENIALALSIMGLNAKEIKAKVNEVSRILGVEEVMDKFPYEMSGGQRQRVACARAVISQPQLVMADEPTGALDSKSAKTLMQTFQKLNKELESTILMVTHDSLTASYSDRVVFLKDGKFFTEIKRGSDSRNEFFKKIMEVVTLLGGEVNEDV